MRRTDIQNFSSTYHQSKTYSDGPLIQSSFKIQSFQHNCRPALSCHEKFDWLDIYRKRWRLSSSSGVHISRTYCL